VKEEDRHSTLDEEMFAPACNFAELSVKKVQKTLTCFQCEPTELNMSPIATKTKLVQFQHPLITSLHHRPYTEDEDVKKLFFTQSEMSELEDDRCETKIADNVETVLEGGCSWDTNMPQILPSESSNLSIEEAYDQTAKPFPVKVGKVGNTKSKSIRGRLSLSPKAWTRQQQKLVNGVQIILYEKSSGANIYVL
jgi:hypothetical protein